MWMHALFCWELLSLPAACIWSLDTYTCTYMSTYRQFIICKFYLSKFHTSKDSVLKYILQILFTLLLGFLKCGKFIVHVLCREQAKRSHFKLSCRAHTFTSFCQAYNRLYSPPGPLMARKKLIRANIYGGELFGYTCGSFYFGVRWYQLIMEFCETFLWSIIM